MDAEDDPGRRPSRLVGALAALVAVLTVAVGLLGFQVVRLTASNRIARCESRAALTFVAAGGNPSAGAMEELMRQCRDNPEILGL
jgi:hypothetical protein